MQRGRAFVTEAAKSDFPESVWNEFFWEGKQYGFGHDLSPAVIFYNRRLFKEKGVPLPPTRWGDPAWTNEKFLDAAKRLTFGEGAQKVWGLFGSRWWVYMHPWVWGNGGTIVSKDDKTMTLDDPKTMEALQWYADLGLVHRMIPTTDQLKELGNDQQGFERGRIAMRIDNASYTVRMRQYMKEDPSFDWEMAPYPAGKAGAFTRVPNNIVTGYKSTKYPEATWTFMKFMGSKEATWDARGMPSRISASKAPEVLGRTPNQNWKLLADAGAVRRSEPRTPYFTNDFDPALRSLYDERYRGHPISNAVEILSSALAVFYLVDGDPKEAILASVNLGRDCDCRAYVAGGLSAALRGTSTIPQEWIDVIENELPTDPYTVSRRSLKDTADGLYAAALNTVQAGKRQVELVGALL